MKIKLYCWGLFIAASIISCITNYNDDLSLRVSIEISLWCLWLPLLLITIYSILPKKLKKTKAIFLSCFAINTIPITLLLLQALTVVLEHGPLEENGLIYLFILPIIICATPTGIIAGLVYVYLEYRKVQKQKI